MLLSIVLESVRVRVRSHEATGWQRELLAGVLLPRRRLVLHLETLEASRVPVAVHGRQQGLRHHIRGSLASLRLLVEGHDQVVT